MTPAATEKITELGLLREGGYCRKHLKCTQAHFMSAQGKAFQFQQRELAFQPTGVAIQASCARQHAMTRHDDGQGVAPHRRSHSASVPRRKACRQRHVAVRYVFTIGDAQQRSEEHTSELQSLMRISYAD